MIIGLLEVDACRPRDRPAGVLLSDDLSTHVPMLIEPLMPDSSLYGLAAATSRATYCFQEARAISGLCAKLSISEFDPGGPSDLDRSVREMG